MNAKLLSDPPASVPCGNGRRLLGDLRVDLGIHLPKLQRWAKRDNRADGIYSSFAGTTVIKVPRDFTTIGPGPASIPGPAFPIMGDRDNYEVAGWIHDALYRWQAPRDIADWVFWWVARSGSKSVAPPQAWFGWAVLRIAGWNAYGNYANRSN